MAPATFSANFETLGNVPDAVAKLRQMVLQMAVQGKLVPQNREDEPVALRLEAHRRASACDRVIKPNRRTCAPQDHAESSDVSLPLGWARTVLDEVCSQVTDGEHNTPPREPSAQIPLVTAKNVRDGFIDLETTDFVSRETAEQSWSRCRPTDNDILMVCVGATTGRLCVLKAPPPVVIVRSVALFRPIQDLVTAEYLALVLKSPSGQNQVWGSVKQSAQPCLYISRSKQIAVALPPLAEQRRIVAKADELMKLCDDLETRLERQREARERLSAASLDRLLSARDPAEFAACWQRICDHFDLLYDAPETIAQLREAGLQLAVQGKLVPQDPKDEPASCLVTAISAERNRLLADRAIRKPKILPAVEPEKAPCDVPSGWSWQRLGSVIDARYPISYGVLVPGPDLDDGIPFVRLQDLSVRSPARRPNKTISADIEAKYGRTRLIGGEILLGVVGSIGKIGIAPQSWAGANIARAVCRLAAAPQIDRDYLVIVLQSAMTQSYFLDATRTLAQPTLNVADVEKALVPLPPLAEQRRIVAKVDHLMSLCDALEAKLKQSQTDGDRLLAAAVHQLLNQNPAAPAPCPA